MITLASDLGWLINVEKLNLEPAQTIHFLGYHFDLVQGLVFPTQKNRTKLTPLKARHLPGSLNRIADGLSRRDKILHSEWSLHPLVFQRICQEWHVPDIDMFATRQNKKLAKFVSPVPDPEAWAVESLSLPLQDLNSYTFCPTAILVQVVQK